jgi:beta-xylosidase
MAKTYTNPVVDRYFADPFVLRTSEGYYAYGTDLRADGARVVPVLHSRDLVTWEDRGSALRRLDLPDARDYWAPEVAEHEGRYFLYYTAGVEDRGHRIRVASSDRPEGPFEDHGRILTGEDPFTIDAHPFRDHDGQWYLFYARDFLDGERAGTALVVDRLVTMDTLAGAPRTVLRASADWQLFQRRRRMYGAVYDWHTLEGPFVVRRGGRYYCLYSGGSWKNETYGVSWAVADAPAGPYHEPPTDAPRLLRTVPGRVLGPGHCSVATGPDGQDYIAYHAWGPDARARRMHVDRLEWTDEGPRCVGPTWTPQPAPSTGATT